MGVGRIGAQETAAHEIGHALGRQHAPCDNVTRCASPRNEDGSYPTYAGYDSDSIGEYGFDPAGSFGSVKSPAVNHDFMGYSPDDWISPYTYKALMSALPVAGGGGAPEAAGFERPRARPVRRAEWVARKTPHLFLRIDVASDGTLTVHEAFHFATLPRPTDSTQTDLSVELRDADRSSSPSTCGRTIDW